MRTLSSGWINTADKHRLKEIHVNNMMRCLVGVHQYEVKLVFYSFQIKTFKKREKIKTETSFVL